jgi:hypothetical protein
MRSSRTLVILALLAACTPEPPADTGGADTGTSDSDTDVRDTDTDVVDTDTDTGVPAPDDDSIYDVQSGVIRLGDAVRVEGVLVTGEATGGFWVQEPMGGRFAGVWVDASLGGAPESLESGDEVTVNALVGSDAGRTVLRSGGASIHVTAPGAGEPAPSVATTAELATPVGADAWEGVLVRVEDVTVTSALGGQNWAIDDGVEVGHRITPFIAGFLAAGAKLAAITGVWAVDPEGGTRLEPRTPSDFEGFEPAVVDPVTIYELSRGDVAVGDAVHLRGVRVTAVADGSIYVQEVDGGPGSGTLAWGGAVPVGTTIGDEVEVWGHYEGAFGIGYVSTTGGYVDITAPGAGELEPEVLPMEVVAGAAAASWNMVLVAVEDVTVELPNDGFGGFRLVGGLSVAQDVAPFTGGPLDPGTTFERIAGVVLHYGGNSNLRPRRASDYAGYVGTPPAGADLLSPGDLVVTEIMFDPSCPDASCEWIEIYNASGRAVDIDRLRLETQRSGGSVLATGGLTGTTLLAAGEYGVIAASWGDTADWTYPFTPNAAWTGLTLSNSTDARVVLSNRYGELDRTALYDSGLPAGTAFQLSDSAPLTAAGNDDAASWCRATATIGGTSDEGTPQVANDDC